MFIHYGFRSISLLWQVLGKFFCPFHTSLTYQTAHVNQRFFLSIESTWNSIHLYRINFRMTFMALIMFADLFWWEAPVLMCLVNCWRVREIKISNVIKWLSTVWHFRRDLFPWHRALLLSPFLFFPSFVVWLSVNILRTLRRWQSLSLFKCWWDYIFILYSIQLIHFAKPLEASLIFKCACHYTLGNFSLCSFPHEFQVLFFLTL